jgi:F-type H+-transporting ATPase subunit b
MDIAEVLGRIGFDWKIALFNTANFLIVFFLLWKFLFSKAIKAVDERQKLMSAGVDNAQKLETEIRDARLKADSLISEAQKQADNMINQTKAEVGELSAKLKADAGSQVEAMIAKARDQIENEKVQALHSVRKEVAGMIIEGTEKLTGKKVDDQVDAKLVDEILAK